MSSATTALPTRLFPPAQLPAAIARALARPDLAIAPHERSLTFAPDLPEPFTVAADGHIRLGPLCLARTEEAATYLRHALELAFLLPRLPQAPTLAALAAARTAALFARTHGAALPPHLDPFAAATPHLPALSGAWPHLARLLQSPPPPPTAGVLTALAEAWPLLGPAETLLQTGGDQRLKVDPATGLNAYGCSHRPRPWAVTFASSTASSSSERGFAAAEATRQTITLAALAGHNAAALADEADAVRTAIAAHCRLPPGGAVVLAASGTDCELLALSLASPPDRPVTNILIAQEETGSGVPLAAQGKHFAPDTARGLDVVKSALIEGYRPDTTLANIPARTQAGDLRPLADIDAACAGAVSAAAEAGRHAILHVLDISKTGFLAPSPDEAVRIAARYPGQVTVVVDACQLRLTTHRIAAYLAQNAIVLITGSKFLTGPPFAGAILIPPAHAARLAAPRPAGLAAYTFAQDWPRAAHTAGLAAGANYGLLLRWRAALAEWDALAAIPPATQAGILAQFTRRIRQGIDANPDVAALDTAPPNRSPEAWDTLPTILGFIVRPHDPLGPEDARKLYHWLNADLRAALPPTLSAEDERLACLRCHIGQPVPLPGKDGKQVGVLRISAGARLISGEPSHHDLDEDSRLLREIRDALSVLAKISLILAHWPELERANPKPRF